ncbi:uncharacterized protein LOC135383918 [Ornithodoros turicata]|uniref:uncharacterized protein LOC135383918 n=1 Tax=Ornithodoros turicata TaxID=34597 RepID=UPI0031394310
MALDLRNVVVNLKALSVTSAAVDACKLALAITTLVRLQPNRGYVFLAALGPWSLATKIVIVVASMVGYVLVFYGAAKDDRRFLLIAAVIFAVSVIFRCMFMVEGALVVVQEDITATITASTASMTPTGAGLYFAHQAPHTTPVDNVPVISVANPMSTTFRILQVNVIHACSIAVHIIFFIVLRKYVRCSKLKLRPEDVPPSTRT